MPKNQTAGAPPMPRVRPPQTYEVVDRDSVGERGSGGEKDQVRAFRVVGDAPEPRKEGRKVAVLVCHGMGQQVAFENIDLVARELAADPEDPEKKPEGRVRYVRLGKHWLPRAEVDVKRGGETVEAHVYEAYWAPLTEGRVKAFDVTRFFLEAGLRGLKFGLRGSFGRWVNGREEQYPIPKASLGYLAVVFAVVVAALALYGALALVAADTVLRFFVDDSALSPALARVAAQWQMRLVHSPLLLSLLLLPYLALKAATRVAAFPFPSKHYDGAVRVLRWVVPLAALLASGVTLKTFVVVVAHLGAGLGIFLAASLLPGWMCFRYLRATPMGTPRPKRIAVRALTGGAVLLGAFGVAAWLVYSVAAMAGDVAGWRVVPGDGVAPLTSLTQDVPFLLFLLTSVYACYRLRGVYIQYLGDVAVYLASHTLNEFADLRSQIRKIGFETGCAIYGAREKTAKGETVFQYDEVLVVGHSLGSVVAYDTLNAVLNEDAVLGHALRARERTRLLATFGSPLDKSAFIFRTQIDDSVFREPLAAAVQPLIEGNPGGKRPIPWVNLHSPFDPVSGPVNYYDTPVVSPPAPPESAADAVSPERGRVVNVTDPRAILFGQAHVTYWKNPLLVTLLREAIHSRVLAESPVHPRQG